MTSIVNNVYVLTWLNFTDDYKPRGGDWAYLKEPRVFNNYKDAKKALEELLIEYINNSDLDLETMKEIGIEYFKKVKNQVEDEDQDKKEDEESEEEVDKYEVDDRVSEDQASDENAEYIFDPEELDFDDFEYIAEALSKGEYVSRKIYYEIHTCKLEDSKN